MLFGVSYFLFAFKFLTDLVLPSSPLCFYFFAYLQILNFFKSSNYSKDFYNVHKLLYLIKLSKYFSKVEGLTGTAYVPVGWGLASSHPPPLPLPYFSGTYRCLLCLADDLNLKMIIWWYVNMKWSFYWGTICLWVKASIFMCYWYLVYCLQFDDLIRRNFIVQHRSIKGFCIHQLRF